jgi:Ca2+-binding RTX toxin-like protein
MAKMKLLSPPLLVGVVALCALDPAGVLGDASHAGWPKIDGKTILNSHDLNETMRGEKHKHNLLLGGNGNDTIYGGEAGDVIWGDYKPSGQPTTQVDRIYAGNGNNFIYTSHGTNIVYTGTGHTIVHAHFGRGVIHCQSPRVVVYDTHHTGYKLVGCRHVSP